VIPPLPETKVDEDAAWRCPCGDAHEGHPMAHQALAAFREMGLSPIVNVCLVQAGPGGANVELRVPRAYVAHHGLRAAELLELAARHGWEEVKP